MKVENFNLLHWTDCLRKFLESNKEKVQVKKNENTQGELWI